MAITATSVPALTISYTLVQTDNVSSVSESTSIGYSTLELSNGTGTGNINIGTVVTGYISSGQKIVYDFRAFPKEVWGTQTTLDFTSTVTDLPPIRQHYTNPGGGIKAILATNQWNGSLDNGIEGWFPITGLPRLNLHATGSYGFTNLFDGESGNIFINPKSTWACVDYMGKVPIYDTSPTAYNYELTLATDNFMDVTGTGGYPIWNSTASANPWSGNLPRIPYEISIIGVTGSNV